MVKWANDKGSAQFAFACGTVIVDLAVAAIIPVVALAPVARLMLLVVMMQDVSQTVRSCEMMIRDV